MKNKKKILCVCGDSYMSPVVSCPNTHHSELVADYLNYDLLPLSRGGMSNLGICLQIEEAIKIKADLVLLGTSSSDRIEIPMGNSKEEYTLENVLYCEHASISSYQRIKTKKPALLIDTLYCLLESEYHLSQYSSSIDSTSQLREDVKQYYKSMFDHQWKQKIDFWSLYASLHRLSISGIPFIIVYPNKDLITECQTFVKEKNFISKMLDSNFSLATGDNDPGYHTSIKDQEVLSGYLIDHIHKYNIVYKNN